VHAVKHNFLFTAADGSVVDTFSITAAAINSFVTCGRVHHRDKRFLITVSYQVLAFCSRLNLEL